MSYVTASVYNRAALLAAGWHCHSMALSIWVLIRQGLKCLLAKAPPQLASTWISSLTRR